MWLLCLRSDRSHLAELEVELAALLRTHNPPLPMWKIAKALLVMQLTGWQPQALCQERVAAWVLQCAAVGNFGITEDHASWCVTTLLHCWVALAQQPGSVAARTLPSVVEALQLRYPACGAGGDGAREIAGHAVLAQLRVLRSASALEHALSCTGALWDVFCTIAALRSAASTAPCAPSACTCSAGTPQPGPH